MEKNKSPVMPGEEITDEIAVYAQMGAAGIVVTNDRELEDANEHLKGVTALIKKIQAWFKKHKDKAREALNGLIADEKELLSPLYETKAAINGQMAPYMEKQKRLQEEAEAAARKAREEAAEAERRRIEAAEYAAKAAEEEKQRRAREALQDGERKKAEKILAQEPEVFIPEVEDVPAPKEIVIPQAKKLKGTFPRTDWTWELENIDLVPRVLPNGKRPLILDRGVITALAEKEKDKAKVPGIRFFPKTTMVSRKG